MYPDNPITIRQATRTGRRQGLLAAATGLAIAQLIMMLFSSDQGFTRAFFWFTDFGYILNVATGALILLICGYFFGGLAGKWILIDKRNDVFAGFFAAMMSLLITAFLSGWLGFFREGLPGATAYDTPFTDYIIKPLFWVVVFGTIPALLVGIWLGWSIQRTGQKLKNP